jgi:hypothetical protein
MVELKNKSILVVGTVRNVERYITKEISRCIKALNEFSHVKFYLVESDSTDNTIKKLKLLQKSLPNFSFTSLGILKQKIPDRLERIRYCRNIYVQYVRLLSDEDRPTYVMVVDLDGMNSALNSKSIHSCFIRDDWNVVIANQTIGYYDILALRHPAWQINDWRFDHEYYKNNLNRLKLTKKSIFNKIKNYLDLDKTQRLAIYSKMIRIPKKNEWIKVDSGFGGAAIYKSQVFLNYDYSLEFETNETDHVTLHRKLVRNGGTIFINPAFINAHLNTYNINKFFLIRSLRGFIWSTKFIYQSKLYKNLKKIFKI